LPATNAQRAALRGASLSLVGSEKSPVVLVALETDKRTSIAWRLILKPLLF